MSILDIFKKKDVVETTITTATVTTTVTEDAAPAVTPPAAPTEKGALDRVAPKEVGKLDMVIAFDTTGSMAEYIGAVRKEVADLIPTLFADNPDLRLGIVAFGDYCDMDNPQEFGKAYQCLMPTDNENDIIRFIRESKNTSGGDGDEFYELVIKKIVEETPWREGSTRSILLIADANPHPLGYKFRNYVDCNQIDWRQEAAKAAEEGIRIDTVTIRHQTWYRELSEMTNGVSVPFRTGGKTARLVEASVSARGSMKSRSKFDFNREKAIAEGDEEMMRVYRSYEMTRNDPNR